MYILCDRDCEDVDMKSIGLLALCVLLCLLSVHCQDNSTDTGDTEDSAGSGDSAPAPSPDNSTSPSNENSPDEGGADAGGGGGEEAVEVTTASTTTTTTTVNPLSLPCQCLGDPELLANVTNNKAVLAVCRENSRWRVTADGLGVVGERMRCGSRTPTRPRWSWDSVCNCTEKEGPAGRAGHTGQSPAPHLIFTVTGKAFWSQFQIKDQDARFRWETYDKLDRDGNIVSTLLDPRTDNFKMLKRIIEEKVNQGFGNSLYNQSFLFQFDDVFAVSVEGVSKGFVKNVLIRVRKGEGTNVTTTTTTSTSTTTTTTTTTEAAGGGDDNSTVVRKRRQATTTTTTTTTTRPPHYNSYYIDFLMETQFMDNTTTKTEFEVRMTTGDRNMTRIFSDDVHRRNKASRRWNSGDFPQPPDLSQHQPHGAHAQRHAQYDPRQASRHDEQDLDVSRGHRPVDEVCVGALLHQHHQHHREAHQECVSE